MDFYTFRVFINENKDFGNPLGIVIDESQKLSTNQRQKISTKSGYSECVFINNIKKADISIYNPQTEVSFAGHAIIGASYFLNEVIRTSTAKINCKAVSYATGVEEGKVWIKAQSEKLPPWNVKEVENASMVENYSKEEAVYLSHTIVWSWIDKEKGIIRARTFASNWGIPEDEANGSGSMKLSVITAKALKVIHGKGSIIYSHLSEGNYIKLTGAVIKDSVISLAPK